MTITLLILLRFEQIQFSRLPSPCHTKKATFEPTDLKVCNTEQLIINVENLRISTTNTMPAVFRDIGF